MAESFTFAYGGTPDGSGAATIHYVRFSSTQNLNYSNNPVSLGSGWSLAYVVLDTYNGGITSGNIILSPGAGAAYYNGKVGTNNATFASYAISNTYCKMASGGSTGGSTVNLGVYGNTYGTVFYV